VGKDAAGQGEIRALVDAPLCGSLTERLAARVYELGRDATIAFAMAVAAHAAKYLPPTPGPHAPPSSIPPYAKGPTGRKRPGKPGARMGHEGRRRATPIPDRVETVEEIEVCPECKGRVLPMRPNRRRKQRWNGQDSFRIFATVPAGTSSRDLQHAARRHATLPLNPSSLLTE